MHALYFLGPCAYKSAELERCALVRGYVTLHVSKYVVRSTLCLWRSSRSGSGSGSSSGYVRLVVGICRWHRKSDPAVVGTHIIIVYGEFYDV